MIYTIGNIIQAINSVLWNSPVIILIFLASAYLTLKLRFFPLFHPLKILRATLFAKENSERGSGLTRFQALSTALAASMGTGNIAGVAAAISIGGKGAVFWMVISAFFVMSFAYAENYLGIKYHAVTRTAGAMSYIEKALRSHKAAALYAAACMLCSFGTGCMSQANSASASLSCAFPAIDTKTAALFLAAAVLVVIMKGGAFIASLAEKLIPVVSAAYILSALVIIVSNAGALPSVISGIFSSAFGIKQITGGFAGTALSAAVTTGIRRGIFSNEAGMGSSVFAHAAADCADPAVMGMWAVLEVFIDTVLCCTLTALAILCTGAEVFSPAGAGTVIAAFSRTFGKFSVYLVSFANVIFAFAAVSGWYFYGEKCAGYLSEKTLLRDIYRLFYAAAVYFGAVCGTELILGFSDIFNALMMFPNIAAVLILSDEVKEKSAAP